MAKVNWRHVVRGAARVVGGAIGAVGGAIGGLGVGAVPVAAAGWTLGGELADNLAPDLPKQVTKQNYSSFNILDSYNSKAKDSPVTKSTYNVEQGQGFNDAMGVVDMGVKTASSLVSFFGIGSGVDKVAKAGTKLGESAANGAKNIMGDIAAGTTSLLDVGTKSLNNGQNLLSGVNLDNSYLGETGDLLKKYSPNGYQGLQNKIKAKNSLYNYNTLLTV